MMINFKEIESHHKIFSNMLNKKCKKNNKNYIKFNDKLPLIPFNNIRIPKTNKNILKEEENFPLKLNSTKKLNHKLKIELNKNEILIENLNKTKINNFLSKSLNFNYNLNEKKPKIFLKTNTLISNKNFSNFNNNFIIYNQTFSGANLIEKNNYIQKINQDKILVLKNILKINNFSIFSVFDGHGPDGHLISKLCSEIIEKTFTNSTNFYIPRNSNFEHLKSLKNYLNSTDIYTKLKENNYFFIKNLIKNIQNSIETSDNDFLFSGSTLCQLILFENKLISINIGDSKAILIKNEKETINLTTEHKPNLFSEKIRIEQNGGEIKRLNAQTPFRVYVKNQNYPGIAMSRSLGDKISKKIGVCFEPEIKEFEIENSKGIVLASDGVWEFVDNEIVCEIFFECYYLKNGEKMFVEKLYEFSKEQFLKREISVDDISIVVVFFGKNCF